MGKANQSRLILAERAEVAGLSYSQQGQLHGWVQHHWQDQIAQEQVTLPRFGMGKKIMDHRRQCDRRALKREQVVNGFGDHFQSLQ
ncbi:hypothetical protein D3C79_1068700 [compost metagenome]